jgi:hypothetical protein
MEGRVYVVDTETDGFVSTKIHVMSVGWKGTDGKWVIKSTADYADMERFMANPDNTVVGHSFKSFDVVEIERVLGIEVKATVIDTLPLSWYIFPKRKKKFGLDAFGEDYGIAKPKVADWVGLSYAEYKHRCEEDVKINIKLWEDIERKLLELYGSKSEYMSLIKYLMFKTDCLVHQQKVGVKLDLDTVRRNIGILTPLREEKEGCPYPRHASGAY